MGIIGGGCGKRRERMAQNAKKNRAVKGKPHEFIGKEEFGKGNRGEFDMAYAGDSTVSPSTGKTNKGKIGKT